MFRAQILASSSGTLRLSVSFGGASFLAVEPNATNIPPFPPPFWKKFPQKSPSSPNNLLPQTSITVVASWKQLTYYLSPFARVRLPILNHSNKHHQKGPLLCSSALLLQMNLTCTQTFLLSLAGHVLHRCISCSTDFLYIAFYQKTCKVLKVWQLRMC